MESENETIRLNMQETERASFNINQMNGNLVIENQQLKDRIALLEKDNELLRNAKVIYETVDYCAEDLWEAEMRIKELEKENRELLKENEGYHGSYRCAIDKIGELSAERYIKVEQFAERLIEKLKDNVNGDNVDMFVECKKLVDETLNEFINVVEIGDTQ